MKLSRDEIESVAGGLGVVMVMVMVMDGECGLVMDEGKMEMEEKSEQMGDLPSDTGRGCCPCKDLLVQL